MSSRRPPRGEPGRATPPRPSDARAASAARTTRWIAAAALVVALLAVGIVAWRLIAPSGGSCQTTAWNATPASEELPAGWTVGTTQFDADRMQMTLLGPLPQDDTTSQAVVYATVTCFPSGAAEAVSRSESAATAAGELVDPRTDLGDQGYSASDDATGASYLQFRHGDVVIYLAGSGAATSDDVDGIGSAFDIAMGGDGGQAAIGTLDAGGLPSEDLSSLLPSESVPAESAAAAPELEAVLPSTVGDVTLTIDSGLGTDLLGDDPGSRAITAALRAEGKSPDDLRLAEAYDDSGTSDLWIRAVSVDGMNLDALKALVLDTWLAASGAGVKQDAVTLAGKPFVVVDYGDEGVKEYVLAEGNMVVIIETADADLAAQAAAALH